LGSETGAQLIKNQQTSCGRWDIGTKEKGTGTKPKHTHDSPKSFRFLYIQHNTSQMTL